MSKHRKHQKKRNAKKKAARRKPRPSRQVEKTKTVEKKKRRRRSAEARVSYDRPSGQSASLLGTELILMLQDPNGSEVIA